MARCGAEEPAAHDRSAGVRPAVAERTRGRRCELLALADSAEIVALAEHCTDVSGPPRIVSGPEVGAISLSVREPVASAELSLADVLVTRAEVLHRDQLGWSMRLGTEPEAALAAAVCDAEVVAGGPLAALVEALCNRTEIQLAAGLTTEAGSAARDIAADDIGAAHDAARYSGAREKA